MEHAKIKMIVNTGITGSEVEEVLVVDWMTKEEWDKLPLEEQRDEVNGDLIEFVWDKIDYGWEEI